MNKLIYICDDNKEILEVTSLILERRNYACHTFTTAGALIDELKHTKPLCIFLDYYLRDMSAEDALQTIRNRGEKEIPPVILWSASQFCPELCSKLKVHDFLAKPFDMKHLLGKIENIENNMM